MSTPTAPTAIAPVRAHLQRLMQLWRGNGWPCRDPVELDLLAAGWAAPRRDDAGRETLHPTAEGLALLAARRQSARRAASPHDRLAERVAAQLHAGGRLVWRELSMRARVPEAADPASADDDATPALPGLLDDAPDPRAPGHWRLARADVFSVRHTSVEAYLHPVVHEVKTSRADLLSDLRHEDKRAAYQGLCSECWYVFPEGVAEPGELPEGLGVLLLRGGVDDGAIEIVRPARHQPCRLSFGAWMALARATPWAPPDASLDDPADGPPPGQGELGRAP